jgi:hypothetical protein
MRRHARRLSSRHQAPRDPVLGRDVAHKLLQINLGSRICHGSITAYVMPV